jgi:type II secretory pathway pseudopilin PulG
MAKLRQTPLIVRLTNRIISYNSTKGFSMRTIKKQTLSPRFQKGFLLLETALALLIVSAVGTIALNAQLADMKDQRAIAQARSLLQVQGGANSYITNYRVQLASNTPITGVASIYDPKVEELAALNVGMPPNFLNAPMIGGSYRVHVATTPSPCTPTDCQITAVSWITQPLKENDGTVDYPRLGLAMQTMGVDGAVSSNIDVTTGVVNAAAAGSIRGPNNAWNMTNPAGVVPGIMAARAGFDSQIFNQFVRRDGQSQMTGNLQLGNGTTNNDIINLKNLTADGQVASNTVIATTSVSSGGAVTAGSSMQAGSSVTAGSSMTAGSSITAGTSMYANSSVTAGTTVTAGTNVIAAGNVFSGGNMNASANVAAGGSVSGGNVSGYNTVCGGNGTSDCTGPGGSKMTGSSLSTPLVVTDQVQLNGIGVSGSSCASNGLVARDASGSILSCASGIWKSIAGTDGMVALGQNGYKVLDSSGLTLQWGWTPNHGNYQSQNFNYCFPNMSVIVNVMTTARPYPGSNGHDYIGSYDRCSFTYTSEPGTDAGGGTMWFALGF